MRAAVLTMAVILSGVIRTLAQQTAPTNQLAAATNNVDVSPRATSTVFQLTQSADTAASEHVVVKRKIRVSGPLVGPVKAKSFSEFSRKVAHLFNPFATDEFNPQGAPSGPVSTRAWSTIVGWTPNGSAFPTEAKHDPPELRLISVNVEKQP